MPETPAPVAPAMNAVPNTAPAAAPLPPSPEMQAALAELQNLTQDPAKFQARAEQLGMGEDYKVMNAKLKEMQTGAQALMQQEQKLQKQYEEITSQAKSSSTKATVVTVLGALLGAGGIYAAIRSKDWGGFRKAASTVGGFLGAGVISGFIGKAMFGSGIEEQAKQLMQQTQELEVAKERMASQAAALQQPFVEKITAKMVEEAKGKAQTTIASSAAEQKPASSASQQSTDSGEVPPAAPSIQLEDRQSVTPEAPASSQSVTPPAAAPSVMGVQHRAASFADQAKADKAKAAAAGVGAPGM